MLRFSNVTSCGQDLPKGNPGSPAEVVRLVPQVHQPSPEFPVSLQTRLLQSFGGGCLLLRTQHRFRVGPVVPDTTQNFLSASATLCKSVTSMPHTISAPQPDKTRCCGSWSACKLLDTPSPLEGKWGTGGSPDRDLLPRQRGYSAPATASL